MEKKQREECFYQSVIVSANTHRRPRPRRPRGRRKRSRDAALPHPSAPEEEESWAEALVRMVGSSGAFRYRRKAPEGGRRNEFLTNSSVFTTQTMLTSS